MDLRSISGNQVAIWLALAVGLLVALVLGSAVGSADVRFVAAVLAVIPAAVIFFKLKTNIWVLIPIGWYLPGRLPWLPLPFSVRDLCLIAAIACFVVFILTRAITWKRKLTTLDYLVYINLAYLATVYVRNPAGFWAFQSSIVGGRAYFEIVLAFCAFLILGRVQISDFTARVFPLFFLVPAWSVALLDVVGRVNVQLGNTLNLIYGGVGTSGTFGAAQEVAEVGTTRLVSTAPAGLVAVLALCSRYNPATLISPLYPLRSLMLAVAFGAIFLSGYRSGFLGALVFFLLAAILRRQLRQLWVAFGMSILAVVTLIILQGNVLQMPLTMQRTLSWLPADWDQDAVSDAEYSTQWRVDMWKWAWNDERVLRDKIWGQGFGFTIEDLYLIASASAAGQSTSAMLGGSDREQFMITGTLHSGPLSSIKFIGIVGFVFYYFMLCYMAVLAWRICKRAMGTKGFTLALFVGIPIIYEPFNFVVVYGALDQNYPVLLFKAGLLMMTQRYVENLRPIVHGALEADYQVPASPVPELQLMLRRQRIVPQPLSK